MRKTRILHVGHIQELKILRKIVDITNTEIKFENILKEVVRIVSGMTKAESVFVYLFNHTKKN